MSKITDYFDQTKVRSNISDHQSGRGMVSAVLASVLLVSGFTSTVHAEELVKMLVKDDGVYQLGHAELADFGLDLSGESLSSISVSNKGREVPIEFVDLSGSAASNPVTQVNAQARFSQTTAIRFIGQSIESLYTDDNVYTLSLDTQRAQPAARIQAEPLPLISALPYAPSYLETKSYAPQNAYSFASPNKQDPWYADRVLALRKPASKTVSLELENYVPGGNTGSHSPALTTKVWGGTDLPGAANDHHVRFKLNGQVVISETFDGFARKQMSAEVSNLRSGANQVTMELPLDQGFDFEAVNLNEVELSYPRAFVAKEGALSFTSRALKFQVRGFANDDISVYRQSANGQITRLSQAQSSGRCTATALRCRARFGGHGSLSTYHVVAPDGLKKPRLAYLPSQQDIRSGSAEYLIITHPDFIALGDESDLLAELATSLQSQYSSVDVVDVEQVYAQFGAHMFDPSAIQKYLQFARDSRGTKVVLLVGGDIYDYKGFENQDAQSFIPSIYVATDDVINFAPVDAKYVDFDNDNVPDLPIARLPVRTMQELRVLLDKRAAYLNRDYQNKALFVADEFDALRQYSFKLDATNAQRDYFTDWQVTRAFLDDQSVSEARSTIINSVNQGVSLTSFFGHSSTNQWTFEGLFNGFDAANLANADKPTIVTQWGCWNSYYVNPNDDSMGHRFLMEGDRGAVAVMGATTLTSATNEQLLARFVYQQIEQGQPLGQAIVNAKQEFAQIRPDALDVLLGWTLLGFPELTL